MDNNTLMANAVSRAVAKAKAEAESKAKAEAESRASKVDAWKQQQALREAAERQARNKDGMALAEEFLRECAAPFTRLMSRDDASKLNDIRINFRPGKSGDSPSYSMQIECSGFSPRLWHRPSIDQMADQHRSQIQRLQEKGGFFQSSPVEMLEEIIKLRDYLSRVGKVVQNIESEDAGKVRDILAPLQLPVEE